MSDEYKLIYPKPDSFNSEKELIDHQNKLEEMREELWIELKRIYSINGIINSD
jgi:hypothetical protein